MKLSLVKRDKVSSKCSCLLQGLPLENEGKLPVPCSWIFFMLLCFGCGANPSDFTMCLLCSWENKTCKTHLPSACPHPREISGVINSQIPNCCSSHSLDSLVLITAKLSFQVKMLAGPFGLYCTPQIFALIWILRLIPKF